MENIFQTMKKTMLLLKTKIKEKKVKLIICNILNVTLINN